MTAEDPTTPWWRRADPWVAAWLIAASLVWGLHGFQDAMSRDAALYVYAGQQVADGQAPYVGVLNRAGPLTHLLPGLGVELGRLTGIGDVTGIRVVFFVLMVFTPPLAYVLARDVFGRRLAGSAAAATLLAFQGLALSATNGPQSKQPMMLGLLVALVLLTRRRWLAAGVVTGLATLTWQPVLVVLAPVALVVAALTPGEPRARLGGVARFVLGGGVALGVTVAYFLLMGAFDAFIEGFWAVNAAYTDQEGIVSAPLHHWDEVNVWLGWTTWLLVAGCVLSVALGLSGLRRKAWPGGDAAALGAATLAGIGWSMSAYNGATDALLVLPMAAAGVGGGVALAHATLPGSWHRPLSVVVAGWVAVALATTLHLTWSNRGPELATARADAEALFAAAPDDATVFAYNAPQPLALTGRESISRYVLFGEGMDDYVASQWSNGFQGYVERLREMRPTVVVTSERGLAGGVRPLARDYVEVDGGPGWRAFLHTDVGPGQ